MTSSVLRTLATLTGLLFLAAAMSAAPDAEPPRRTPLAIGESVPDLSLPGLDGDRHTLSAAEPRGAKVLVFFRGVW